MSKHGKRAYIRTDVWSVVAKVSADKTDWSSALVPSISAGGLLFVTDKAFQVGGKVWVDLDISPVIPSIEKFRLSEQCTINGERERGARTYTYGAEFTEMKEETRIRLDELITRTVAAFGG